MTFDPLDLPFQCVTLIHLVTRVGSGLHHHRCAAPYVGVGAAFHSQWNISLRRSDGALLFGFLGEMWEQVKVDLGNVVETLPLKTDFGQHIDSVLVKFISRVLTGRLEEKFWFSESLDICIRWGVCLIHTGIYLTPLNNKTHTEFYPYWRPLDKIEQNQQG